MINNIRAMYEVMRDAKLPGNKLEHLIYNRLKNVLISAYENVPYYQEIMKNAGYNPSVSYRGPNDLSILPITNRETLKKRGENNFIRIGADLSNSFKEATSGSTGIPVTIYRGHYERSFEIAKWLRVLFINGYSINKKVLSLTSPSRLNEGKTVLHRFGLLRRMAIDYLSTPEKMVDKLLEYKPHVLYGNRSQLDIIAFELEKRSEKPQNLQILIGTGEVIRDSNRQLYRKIFGVDLTETYGSVEMGAMAFDTPERDGMHLCEDLTYFEFLDEKGDPVPPGQPGRVVVTDLVGRLMPFIRYDMGDSAIYENIIGKDSNIWRRLRKIIGRDDDVALLPDGTSRSFVDFYEVLELYTDIMQWRIVQKNLNTFIVYIVADNSYFESIHRSIITRFKEKFPHSIDFNVIRVEKIDPDRSGKHRKIVSELKLEG
jgi:phenylacetate-CoA ligase